METSSSSAQNRELTAWFNCIKSGQIKLPRFQRMEAWDKNRVKSFLKTIIYNLPVGVALNLKVGDKQKFESRFINTAKPSQTEKVAEHLLDGQQRLTAFWRAMHNNYENETYFVYFPEFDNYDTRGDDIDVYCVTRYLKKEQLYPLWVDRPKDCFIRGCIPMQLFRPEDIHSETESWINAAIKHLEPSESDADGFSKLRSFNKLQQTMTRKIDKLRETVAHFNLPYLSLPVSTPKEVALQVFINMNTNSKPLSIYDIIVAEVENEKGAALHDLNKALDEKHPTVKFFFDLEFLILATSALIQNKLPNNKGMIDMSKPKMVENWELMENCLGRMAKFLEGQGIFDKQRLPTNAVLAVIAACYSLIPEVGDESGKGEVLLKKYLWSSFFTDRYENSAASRAYVDYIALKNILKGTKKEDGDQSYKESDVPVLNRNQFKLVAKEELLSSGWPMRQNIRARGILAISTLLGALDFADGQKVTRDNLNHREYHHIFPTALLEEAGIDSFRALNCALITGTTNRKIGRKDPLVYLEERYDWVDSEIVHDRLDSHLIPINELATGGYEELSDDERVLKIKSDFRGFMEVRAKLISKAVHQLTSGKSVTAALIINDISHKTKEEICIKRIQQGENKCVEFKSTLRYCLHRKSAQIDIEHSSFKNIAAFMNSEGGDLFIGVDDEKNILGLENDFNTFSSSDKIDSFLKHFDNLVSNYFGNKAQHNLNVEFPVIDGNQIAVISIREKSLEPIWLTNKSKNVEQFYIRRSASTVELSPREAVAYINEHWG